MTSFDIAGAALFFVAGLAAGGLITALLILAMTEFGGLRRATGRARR